MDYYWNENNSYDTDSVIMAPKINSNKLMEKNYSLRKYCSLPTIIASLSNKSSFNNSFIFQNIRESPVRKSEKKRKTKLSLSTTLLSGNSLESSYSPCVPPNKRYKCLNSPHTINSVNISKKINLQPKSTANSNGSSFLDYKIPRTIIETNFEHK